MLQLPWRAASADPLCGDTRNAQYVAGFGAASSLLEISSCLLLPGKPPSWRTRLLQAWTPQSQQNAIAGSSNMPLHALSQRVTPDTLFAASVQHEVRNQSSLLGKATAAAAFAAQSALATTP